MNIKFFLLMLFSFGYTKQACSLPLQTTSSIQKSIKQYIASRFSSDTEYKISISPFDNRLQLPLCNEQLNIFTRGDLQPGRNSVGVSCNSAKKWTIYASVTISIYKNIILLSQSVRRGDIFNKNSLQFKKLDIANLHSGYFTNPDNIINKEATRNMAQGAIINKTNVTEPKLIKRREIVQIKAISPNLEISAEGIAMMDGIKGQNIRVKNLKSQQIIQATVIKPGQVEVIF